MNKNQNNFITKIRKIGLKLLLPTGLLALLLLTGCGGVAPPEPVQKIEIPTGFDKDYFEEICFSTEFPSNNPHDIYRWTDDPKIFLINPPTEEKRKICEDKIDELAEFTNYVVIPEIVDNINSANITVEWCELEEIPYGNVAYFTFSHKNGVIYEGEILRYKNLDDILEKHGFLEEVGGVLGVTNDSYKYDDSIFYQGPCQSVGFTIQDLAVGNVLYQLEPGTSKEEFNEIYGNSKVADKSFSVLANF